MKSRVPSMTYCSALSLSLLSSVTFWTHTYAHTCPPIFSRQSLIHTYSTIQYSGTHSLSLSFKESSFLSFVYLAMFISLSLQTHALFIALLFSVIHSHSPCSLCPSLFSSSSHLALCDVFPPPFTISHRKLFGEVLSIESSKLTFHSGNDAVGRHRCL